MRCNCWIYSGLANKKAKIATKMYAPAFEDRPTLDAVRCPGKIQAKFEHDHDGFYIQYKCSVDDVHYVEPPKEMPTSDYNIEDWVLPRLQKELNDMDIGEDVI